MENNYQVFIASSLRLQQHRSAAKEAIDYVNGLPEVKDQHIHFSEFIYENRPINQKVEKEDAQKPADAALRQSTLFFLIIDDIIRDITRYEFELAYQYFSNGELPQYIYIFLDESKKDLPSTDEGWSYEKFKKEEGLEFYVPDRQNEIVAHSRVYPIPFKAPDGQMDDLREKMQKQLLAFAKSDEKPFPGALRGNKLTKDHFFTDLRRRARCSDTYLRRDFDNQLDNAIRERNRHLVILTGFSLSGKTRAVMETMRTVDDGWVYLVKMEDAAKELERIYHYLAIENHPKLYIVFDNYDQWAGDAQVAAAFEKVLGIIGKSNDIIVMTSSTKEIPLHDDTQAEWIEIKEMEERDFADVRDFFVATGVKFDERNLHYRRTGALFVDLEDIKRKYKSWLDDRNDKMKVAKHALLKAIKALSIWRDDNIGNRKLMEGLTIWFCRTEMNLEGWDKETMVQACQNSLNSLIKDRKMGVSSAGRNTPVIVQEYIYRYFIYYDGTLRYDDNDSTFEDELDLAKEVLLFCHDNLNEEALTVQVSRLCRRCSYNNKKAIVSWLYNIWSGICEPSASDRNLAKILKEDREQCEASVDERIRHLYSNLIETYIYYGCETMEEARNAYNRCPQTMRTDHLLSALMRKVKPEERDDIRKMGDYKNSIQQAHAYVIAVEVEWAENYEQAKKWIEHYSLYGKSNEEITHFMQNPGESEKTYEWIQLRRSVGTLALKVTNLKEFDDFCSVVRKLYLYLAENERALREIRCSHSYNPKNLTLIDLFAVIPNYALNGMLEKVFGGNLKNSVNLINELVQCVEKTLNGRFTDLFSLRLTVGYIGSQLIQKLSKEPYDDVFEGIFKSMVVKINGKDCNLRTIYTYTAMLNNSSCSMHKANSLLMDYLIPHTTDDPINNPLSMNTKTLNLIMKKYKGKNREHNIQTINTLYKQRDSHTYCLLISAAKNGEQALKLLKEMEDTKGLGANVYALCELMKRPKVDLNQALTMMDLSEVKLPEEYEFYRFKKIEGFDPYVIIDRLRESMSNMYKAWGNLFMKKCSTSEDKEVLSACLMHLEEHKPQLLEDGSIYNYLISNESYMPFVNDVMNFVRARKEKFRPDRYTAQYVVDRITKLYGEDRQKGIDRLNELLAMVMQGKGSKMDNYIVNYRLKLFRNQQESLKMDFYNEQGEKIPHHDKNGKEIPMAVSAFKYLEAMKRYGYSLESYAISNFIAIEGEKTDNPYTKLMEEFPDLKTTALLNQSLLWQFKAGKITIDEAFENINWDKTYDATRIFSDMLNHYIDIQPQKMPPLFDDVMEYYIKWIKEPERKLTTTTMTILSKATSCWEEMKNLLNEFDEQKQKHKNEMLMLTSMMLSVMSRYTDTIEELNQRSSMMQHKGCPPSSMTADTFVFNMVRHLLTHDFVATTNILKNLFRYIIEGDQAKDIDTEELFGKNRHEWLMLDLYKDNQKDNQNVSSSLLRTFIYYNAAEEHLYDVEQMMACVRKHKGCILPLMERLVSDAMDEDSLLNLPLREGTNPEEAQTMANEIAATYIPRLFSVNNRPSLSAKVLSYYVVHGLQPDNLEAYRQFIKKMYDMDCREIEGAVPGLAVFLNNYLKSQKDESEDVKKAHKTLAQIIVYTRLNKLRNRHLLLEEVPEKKVPKKFPIWRQRMMNCDEILKNKLSEWESLMSIPWSDLIKTHTGWLDDAYPCSLICCSKMKKIDDELEKEIRLQENRYTQGILSGAVYFKDVLKLPKMWFQAHLWPSTENPSVVMAMVRSLSRVAWSPDTNGVYHMEEYQMDARKRYEHINKSFKYAYKQKWENVPLNYEDLGTFTSNKKYKKDIFIIKMPAMQALMYALYLDRMAYVCSKKDAFITINDGEELRCAEKWCVQFMETTDTEMVWLKQLPERWKKIKDQTSKIKNNIWRPSNEIVLAILKNYVHIAIGNGENADIAHHYIERVRKAMASAHKKGKWRAMINYSMLGETTDDGEFLLVPLNLLKKIIKEE